MSHASHYLTPRAVPYSPLSVASAFQTLTSRQRLYAHHLMMAGWAGTPIVATQLSPESLPALRLFHRVLSAQPLAAFRSSAVEAGVSADEVEQFLEYAAMLYSNMGNYLSFGDSKFIPACSAETFTKIVKSAHAEVDAALLKEIYDLGESKMTLAYPPKGISAYYSENITEEDAVIANEFLASKVMEGVNTRVWKAEDGTLEIRVASVEEKYVPPETFKGRAIAFRYGDFKTELARVVEHLVQARAYADNEIESRMLDHYIAHFRSGDVREHKESQKEWVKDIGPAVECNIGFVESYRDPSGVRAEWEGFVAVVDKAKSERYGTLVRHAETFIARLPWGKAFEKDTFSSPDFTSLDVLGFATSGIPSGINIPNYDDVRQEYGFKNVYLANVVSAINYDVKINHITDADWALFKEYFVHSTSVNVGIHELLGHGTGKLLSEAEDGSVNFDRATIDPISKQPVATWYKPGETFGSVFGGTASSYEECRAEAVALYLCVHADLLAIFDQKTEPQRQNTIHMCWLNMVRAGLLGLEYYTPESQQWRQAHMRARYCILQVLLRAANPIVHITEDEKEGLVITVDADRIATDGVAAIGELLVNLSVNKSVANAARGIAYYANLTEVHEPFLKYRDIIMARRKPRRQYVQPHTAIQGDDVVLHEFAGSVDGVIESFLTRHKDVPL